MNIVISACLLGECCKYNGGHNRREGVIAFVEGHHVIPVCPECLGGLPTPRVPAELRDGRVVNAEGADVDAAFRMGAARAMEKLEGLHVDLAILQSRSPSCGASCIYDGTFSGHLIPGQGVFAEMLTQRGITIMESEAFSK